MLHRPTFQLLTIIIAAIASCMLPSCRSSRNASGPTNDRPTQTVPAQTSQATASPRESVETLFASYRQWTDVSMPVKCVLRSPKSLSISGKASMIRGQEIRISMRMLGFEVGGLYADTDSIFFYEKLNRTMVVESMAKLTAATGLQLEDIQDILLGQVTYPGSHSDNSSLIKRFNIETENNRIALIPRKSSIPWLYYLASSPDVSLESLAITLSGKGSALCRWAYPLQTDAGPVSPSADITATLGKQSVDASFIWTLETASWNNGLTPQRNLPKGYRRIPFMQLVKSLGSNK